MKPSTFWTVPVQAGLFAAIANAQGCPRQSGKQGPPASRPKNCPEWSAVPSVKGTLKDNECLVGGIMGGDFWNPCFAPDMGSAMGGLRDLGKSTSDWSGGTGPYSAKFFTDPSLPKHTIYAPKSPPKGKKLPLIVWGNGACGTDGAGFSNFLTEIASYGFIAIANGSPKKAWGSPGGGLNLAATQGEKTRASQLTEAIDWAVKGAAGGKFGEVDVTKIGAGGQSCGGVEAYSASVYDPRVKVIGIFNTGVIDPGRRWMLKELKQPVGYFYGGAADFSQKYIEQDLKDLRPDHPAMMSIAPSGGHFGTYFETHGGKYGKIAVAWWKWQLQGDQTSKKLFFDTTSSLYKDGWKIRTAHWKET